MTSSVASLKSRPMRANGSRADATNGTRVPSTFFR
jgi:hypothetical protein